eukprot:CAMPEP_0119162616 /NCGR_PEP_ID=MMETSP1315-20130426/2590_1 /TAXON_ID=676789 /ORGANISM="Prasinoderma singularis, Strain RCC927" /LENGTH=169 /DNA_ID=CAMNT_0007155503 /DNA_START=119 /DNA_END=626 /DNA_ORIENTATION=+
MTGGQHKRDGYYHRVRDSDVLDDLCIQVALDERGEARNCCRYQRSLAKYLGDELRALGRHECGELLGHLHSTPADVPPPLEHAASQAEVTRPPDAVSRAEANAERRVGQREGGVQQTYEHRCHQPDLFAHRRLAAGGDPRLRRSALLCAREVAHRRGRHARTHLTGRAL